MTQPAKGKTPRPINDKKSQCGKHDSTFWVWTRQSDGTLYGCCVKCLKEERGQ